MQSLYASIIRCLDVGGSSGENLKRLARSIEGDLVNGFWRFRQKLDKLLLMDKLLQEINSQLIDKGLYIKSGGVSIVDASVIEAKQCRPNKDKDKHSTQDPDAKWNVKAGRINRRLFTI
jgi:IS5 family transposase